MKIAQVATALNGTINEMQIGEKAVVKDDLSNIVDVGRELDGTDVFGSAFDSFVGTLIDQIGKVMFVDRVYRSQAPNIMKDGWEYGSILEKVRCELPDAQDNDTWALPTHISGGTYPDPFELSPPDVKAKFFNSKATYEVPITLTVYQVKEAFKSAGQMASFVAMIENRIQMKMTLCNDGLIMATIANLMAQKIATGANIVNLVELYNDVAATAIGADDAWTDKEFLRFASKCIGTYQKYLQGASVLYNNGGYCTFTPADRLKFIALTEFAKALDAYLYSDTYHNEFVKLPGYEEVAYWQGSGNDASDASDRGKIFVDIDVAGTKTTVNQEGIVAVMFDDEAAAVCNQNYRVTSIYNPRGEYTNYFYKWDAMYMNDTNENCVVFVINDYTTPSDLGGSAPADWSTAYAISSSPWYEYAPATGAYNQLGTSSVYSSSKLYVKKIGA